MKYDPQIHNRRSIRLKEYDYSQAGAYFITICCNNRILRFGNINLDAEMILNEFGQVAYTEWIKLSERFQNVSLDVFQIMPNHMHGIITLNNVGATLAVAQNNVIAQNNAVIQNNVVIQNDTGAQNNVVIQNNMHTIHINNWAGASPAPTIGDIVGAYKSLVANGCLNVFKRLVEAGVIPEHEMMGKLWQRNYYEHIIRNEQAYHKISDYIINNPKKWMEDKFFRM